MAPSAPCFADLIRVIRPRLSPRLVDLERQQHLQQLAASLPPVYCGGFEIRLGKDSGQVDLHQCIAAAGYEPERFFTFLQRSAAVKAPGWRQVAGLFGAWRAPGSLLHENIRAVWLEFDIPAPKSSLPLPKIFVRIRSDKKPDSGPALSELARALSSAAESDFCSEALAVELDRIETALPETAAVTHIGFLLRPSSPTVRLNIDGVAPADLPALLSVLRWPHPAGALIRYCDGLFPLVDPVVFSVDVGVRRLDEIGIECFLPARPGDNPNCRSFFAGLVEDGLCTEAQKSALFAWPGQIDPVSSETPWPNRLVIESMLRPPEVLSCIFNTVNHVKIRWGPKGPMQAKAYFGAEHIWTRIGGDGTDAPERQAADAR